MLALSHFFIFAIISSTITNTDAFSISSSSSNKLGTKIPSSSFSSGSSRSGALLSTSHCNTNQQPNNVRLHMSTAASIPKPIPNLAVSLDQPLLPSPSQKFCSPSGSCGTATAIAMKASSIIKKILPVLLSDAVKVFSVAFGIALVLSIISRSSSKDTETSGVWEYITKTLKGRFTRISTAFQSVFTDTSSSGTHTKSSATSTSKKSDMTPMPFDGDDGWGVCTFKSKSVVGKSGYVTYEFDLPKKEYTLPLNLGQKIRLCCLDEEQGVVQGEFYVFSSRDHKGGFSIVVPELSEDVDGAVDVDVEEEIGKDNAKFAQVLKTDLTHGDEVAIQPGPSTLSYRGQYLPVTDMVYFTSGSGIVPIVDQIKSVLPRSSGSSVRAVSVVWCNSKTLQFDLAFGALEDEFYKYNTKLEVSCCLLPDHQQDQQQDGEEEFQPPQQQKHRLEDVEDIVQSVPDFIPGTMAVVSGPAEFSEKGEAYLMKRGYPADCICTLPS